MTDRRVPYAKSRSAPAETRWITSTVALFAVAVFAVSGSQVLPLVVTSQPIPPTHVTAFLLNIALVLFAWRRSEQLKKTWAERDAAQDRAFTLEYYDEVTGLFNRRRLNQHLEELCSVRRAQLAVMLIDLDHFKKINDLYGHAVGDELLAVVAERLSAACPAEATCFRMGGDEFAVVLARVENKSFDADGLAEKLLAEATRPIHVAGTTTAIGVSIGLASLSKKCSSPVDLLHRADVAMYEAKRLGRNRWLYFSADMEIDLACRTDREAQIRSGIAAGEFQPHFQPIVDLDSGEVRGFEVLARWRHPSRGLLEPEHFIGLAEATGMISDLSFGVMQRALTIARDWPGDFTIAVNISPVQFSDPLIAQRILKVLAETGFPAARLELEIREKSLLDDYEVALATITSLKNSGISVSVDDFGTGYASLTRLKALPFDRIKLDRDLINTLLRDGQCDALLRAVSTLGVGLKLPITAEGVETEAVYSKLAELGCTDAQGWLFGKALSADEVEIGFFANTTPGKTAEA